MTTTHGDDTRLREIGAGKPEKAPRPRESYLRTPEPEIAPHGPEIPSRSTVTADERIASAVRSATYASRITGIGAITTSDGVSEALDDERRAFRDLIASLEAQLAEERAKIAALSQPRVFTLSGVVESDLAERYKSLCAAHEEMTADLAEATRAVGTVLGEKDVVARRCLSAERQLADVTTDRDALREIIERKDSRINDLAADKVAFETAYRETETRRVNAERALADMTAERDAAAENARRERARALAMGDRISCAIEAICAAAVSGVVTDTLWAAPAETLVDYLGATIDEETRPVVRVVTSPRFYSDEEVKAAVGQLWARFATSLSHGERPSFDYYAEAVDAVAEALGMRRAQS